MKRIILALMLIIMPVACMQPQTEQSGLASPVPETQPETVEVSLQPARTEAAPTAPATDVPEETYSPEPTEPPKALQTYIGVANETPTDTLELPITIKEIDWAKLSAGKQYETKFYNETVNFQNLRVTVTDFVSDEGGTQFTMRLDLPEEWTDLQCLSMNPCFGFRFYLDDTAQNDFRLTDQSVIDESLLRTETLGELAAALQKMPRELMDIVVMRYYDGKPLTQIAEIMGLSYGAVKLRHQNALELLRRALKQ